MRGHQNSSRKIACAENGDKYNDDWIEVEYEVENPWAIDWHRDFWAWVILNRPRSKSPTLDYIVNKVIPYIVATCCLLLWYMVWNGNFVAWYKEWNYGAFAEGATYRAFQKTATLFFGHNFCDY